MFRKGVGEFKYFVGISSLAQIATRDDRVCVLNILGGESSDVTPVGHAYSGGNVVFGTSPGRRGQVLETPLGNVPVYNSVLEGLNEGHRFNCGVIYLPPSAARDGVAELIRVNPDLKKIFMVTEKMSVHDAREIRAMGQANGIDMIQFDEPAFNVYMDEVSDWGIKALERAAEGLTCATAVHICYGYGIKANTDWKETLGSEWRQYEDIFPAIAASPSAMPTALTSSSMVKSEIRKPATGMAA
jgi:hypothetical protein